MVYAAPVCPTDILYPVPCAVPPPPCVFKRLPVLSRLFRSNTTGSGGFGGSIIYATSFVSNLTLLIFAVSLWYSLATSPSMDVLLTSAVSASFVNVLTGALFLCYCSFSLIFDRRIDLLFVVVVEWEEVVVCDDVAWLFRLCLVFLSWRSFLFLFFASSWAFLACSFSANFFNKYCVFS